MIATELLDAIVRQMRGMWWIVDRDLRIAHVGGATQEIVGYISETHVGKTLHDMYVETPGSVDASAMYLRVLAGETMTFEREHRGRMLAMTLAPLREHGDIVGVIATGLDVTGARMLERRMVDAQRAESLGVLAGGLAHDFNNLLVAILGNADLALREIAASTAGRDLIENIRNAALRAAELTDQLLTYSGKGGVAMTRLSPGPLVAELLKISTPSFADISVVVDIPNDLVLRGDPSQVRQILMNLLNNARDALGGRGGTISVRGATMRHDGDDNPDDIVAAVAGPYVVLEVSDDGPGIDREARRHIFDPFFTTKKTGHGLGLASVVGIVRAHGGGLRLVSAPGQGARFQVLLPATVTPPIAQRAVAAGSAEHRAVRTVLVIDDEELVREVVGRMIEDLGYAVVTAADGPAGLAALEKTEIDAVIVDLSMPMMSGADVISALRAKRPTLPVVLCSGYDRAKKEIVADAYLPKPFRLDSLEQTLAKLLGD